MKFRGFNLDKLFVNVSSQWEGSNFDLFAIGYVTEDDFNCRTHAIYLTVLGISFWFGWWTDADNATGAAPATYRTLDDWRHAFRGAEGGKVS